MLQTVVPLVSSSSKVEELLLQLILLCLFIPKAPKIILLNLLDLVDHGEGVHLRLEKGFADVETSQQIEERQVFLSSLAPPLGTVLLGSTNIFQEEPLELCLDVFGASLGNLLGCVLIRVLILKIIFSVEAVLVPVGRFLPDTLEKVEHIGVLDLLVDELRPLLTVHRLNGFLLVIQSLIDV